MTFSDPWFLFGFLPIFLIFYYLIADRFHNCLIIFAGILFYSSGEHKFLWLLLFSTVVNFAFGVVIEYWGWDRSSSGGERRRPAIALLIAGIAVNLTILLYFKYFGFLFENGTALLKFAGVETADRTFQITLPLGVSFFTFQGISYLVDVYRGDILPTRSLVRFAAYKLLFPQLIAGPIVRYAEISNEVGERAVSPALAVEGVRRFVIGLSKKVLLADTFALAADGVFGADAGSLSLAAMWLGAICYALQLYFDFSAYSDMAIGLGRMMGFHYPENFNYPYAATSIRDFWRRWHMTLTRWFKDYVYIPLGGNRSGSLRTSVNLLCVFLLTGLWHGAAWTFVVWGLWHGLFMMFERRFAPERWRLPRALLRLYTLLVVVIGWVLFRSNSLPDALARLECLIGLGPSAPTRVFDEFFTPVLGIALVFGLAFCAPLAPWLSERIHPRLRPMSAFAVLAPIFLLAATKAGVGTYSPFLYFRF